MSDNRHPEELLAGYADGSLSDRERAAVESHLSTCARCREESGLAMRAVATLNELDDVPVPVGVMSPVTAELARRMSLATPRPLSQRVLWAAGGAIAAAFIGLMAIWVLPGVGANDNAGGGAAAPEAAAASRSAAPGVGGGGALSTSGADRALAVTIEHRSTNYDDAALQALAKGIAEAAKSGSFPSSTDQSAGSPATASAEHCLAQAGAVEPRGVLVRLIAAKFRGQSVIIGAYLTSPGAGLPPTEVDVWAVPAGNCGWVANFTYQPI
jgi:predicted anti-sigma-YlaC factor YlaD